jgi:glycosyltransferase involved in cell wall biosynthesis
VSSCRTLYLSYDGMTDPLGGSQVLPYLQGLSAKGHRIVLISFEKPGRTDEEWQAVRDICSSCGIQWHPLRYHKRPPILSTLVDAAAMRRLASKLHSEAPFDLVHCRSYIAALVGLHMKRARRSRFLFDMRGFWPDERVDGKQWNLDKAVYRAVYRYFKKKEAEFLSEADYIVSLTEVGKQILLDRSDRVPSGPPITVIPCCVDFDAFAPVELDRRSQARKALGLSSDQPVVIYLGSIGSWYMLDEMLDCFRVQLDRDPTSIFLIITRESAEPIFAAAAARGIDRQSLLIRPASRREVPIFASAADYALFFIKPAFSKKASSPTKMGEFLALELPMITNGNVGDVAEILQDVGAGVVVEAFDRRSYERALDRMTVLKGERPRWREKARRWFDLEHGVEHYDAIYCDAAAT